MTEMSHEMESTEDILISRVIDGFAAAEDWRAFSALAAADPGVWERLAAQQADREALALAVQETTAVADAVSAPVGREAHAAPLRFAGWTGWAAAAAIVLAWTWFGNVPAPVGGGAPAITPVSLSADDALARYIEASTVEKRFIRELPKVMVESRRADNGTGMEITYLRQFLERATVDDLYEVSTDEYGRPGAVRVSNPVSTRSVLY